VRVSPPRHRSGWRGQLWAEPALQKLQLLEEELLLLANKLYSDYNTCRDWLPAPFAWIKYTPGEEVSESDERRICGRLFLFFLVDRGLFYYMI
jgi:hypothetical protein